MDNLKIGKGLVNKFNEYIESLIEELESYPSEDQLWLCADGISNSAGNLATHLVGNLNHFIGAVLADTGYVRDRPLEFSIKNKSREIIVDELKVAKDLASNTLSNISDEDYFKTYPFTFGKVDFKPTTHEWMLQILSHLAYHIGQINYHRRLLANS